MRRRLGQNLPKLMSGLLLDVMMGDATLFTRSDEVQSRLGIYHADPWMPGSITRCGICRYTKPGPVALPGRMILLGETDGRGGTWSNRRLNL